MANHKSAIKRHRQSLKRRDRNRVIKSAVRTVVKKARKAAEEKSPETLVLAVKAEQALAKAAQKGIFNKKTAQRYISRLTKHANAAIA
jgi:small subunit ribosomal protein S20